jgi:hypothetical protein
MRRGRFFEVVADTVRYSVPALIFPRIFMDENAILSQLEELAQRLGITVRHESMDGTLHAGGFCRIQGQDFAILNKKATTREKMYVLVDALKRYDLSQIYVLPSLRVLLDVENNQ